MRNEKKLFRFKNEMMAHSVNMFRNCSVVHDLSTSKDYSTMLCKFISMWDGEKNETCLKKKQILELKQQRLLIAKISKVIRRGKVIHDFLKNVS